ncbi:hypothetical protein DMTZ50_0480 [Dehalococcoides mccartyi]|uniref:hypothetical protein n=1 Tax=Dehalococcoides mccartyi TaxID=61435 RepID=UPI0015E707E9|nr:hypothetical protein [Dehalococcoides mccartyi]MBA2084675.1 hypothetical protein [Dehalococcoides mccartyi]
MRKLKLFSIIIEVVGVAAIGTGIGVELATHADIGWATITIGSCLVAMGGVIWGKFIRGGLL